MATVEELTALYENFMLGPRHAAGVCTTCFNLTAGYRRCYACSHCEQALAAVLPISYSVAHEQLHHALASYKRINGAVSRRLAAELAAVLWRFLEVHESCLARAVGAESFPLVTTVPSSAAERDRYHPLRRIVGELARPTRERYERLLHRSTAQVQPREFSSDKYQATRQLAGEAVLLIDDTWTTGANAQSAAAALRLAGSGPVAAVVIGRHVNREWRKNNRRLVALPHFDWSACALCAGESPEATAP